MGVFNDAYVTCVLICFIKVFTVGTHLNCLNKFIKQYMLMGTHFNCQGNSNEYQPFIK